MLVLAGFFTIAGLVLAGFLCLPTADLERTPLIKGTVDKLKAYKARIGRALIAWGLLILLSALILLRGLKLPLLWWLTLLAESGLCLLSGYLLGYESIRDNLLTDASENLQENARALHGRLASSSRTIAVACLALAGWRILYSLVLFTTRGAGG